MNDYEIGEVVTYYPPRLTVDDNRHWLAKIVGITKSGKFRVEGENLAGKFKATCAKYRLVRQGEPL